MLFYAGIGLDLILGLGIGVLVSVLFFSRTKNLLAKALNEEKAIITDYDLLCGECKKVCSEATRGFFHHA